MEFDGPVARDRLAGFAASRSPSNMPLSNAFFFSGRFNRTWAIPSSSCKSTLSVTFDVSNHRGEIVALLA